MNKIEQIVLEPSIVGQPLIVGKPLIAETHGNASQTKPKNKHPILTNLHRGGQMPTISRLPTW
jgi:hypothetical protein